MADDNSDVAGDLLAQDRRRAQEQQREQAEDSAGEMVGPNGEQTPMERASELQAREEAEMRKSEGTGVPAPPAADEAASSGGSGASDVDAGPSAEKALDERGGGGGAQDSGGSSSQSVDGGPSPGDVLDDGGGDGGSSGGGGGGGGGQRRQDSRSGRQSRSVDAGPSPDKVLEQADGEGPQPASRPTASTTRAQQQEQQRTPTPDRQQDVLDGQQDTQQQDTQQRTDQQPDDGMTEAEVVQQAVQVEQGDELGPNRKRDALLGGSSAQGIEVTPRRAGVGGVDQLDPKARRRTQAARELEQQFIEENPFITSPEQVAVRDRPNSDQIQTVLTAAGIRALEDARREEIERARTTVAEEVASDTAGLTAGEVETEFRDGRVVAEPTAAGEAAAAAAQIETQLEAELGRDVTQDEFDVERTEEGFQATGLSSSLRQQLTGSAGLAPREQAVQRAAVGGPQAGADVMRADLENILDVGRQRATRETAIRRAAVGGPQAAPDVMQQDAAQILSEAEATGASPVDVAAQRAAEPGLTPRQQAAARAAVGGPQPVERQASAGEALDSVGLNRGPQIRRIEAQLEAETGAELTPGEDIQIQDGEVALTESGQQDVRRAQELDDRTFVEFGGQRLEGVLRDIQQGGAEFGRGVAIGTGARAAAGGFGRGVDIALPGDFESFILGQTAAPQETFEGLSREFVEGGGESLGALVGGIPLLAKEGAELGLATGEAVTPGGETAGEFSQRAGARGVEIAEGVAGQVERRPIRFLGGVAATGIGIGAGIRTATRLGGRRAGTAVDFATQPGEAAVRAAIRAGRVPESVRFAVPGVRAGQLRGGGAATAEAAETGAAGGRSGFSTPSVPTPDIELPAVIPRVEVDVGRGVDTGVSVDPVLSARLRGVTPDVDSTTELVQRGRQRAELASLRAQERASDIGFRTRQTGREAAALAAESAGRTGEALTTLPQQLRGGAGLAALRARERASDIGFRTRQTGRETSATARQAAGGVRDTLQFGRFLGESRTGAQAPGAGVALRLRTLDPESITDLSPTDRLATATRRAGEGARARIGTVGQRVGDVDLPAPPGTGFLAETGREIGRGFLEPGRSETTTGFVTGVFTGTGRVLGAPGIVAARRARNARPRQRLQELQLSALRLREDAAEVGFRARQTAREGAAQGIETGRAGGESLLRVAEPSAEPVVDTDSVLSRVAGGIQGAELSTRAALFNTRETVRGTNLPRPPGTGFLAETGREIGRGFLEPGRSETATGFATGVFTGTGRVLGAPGIVAARRISEADPGVRFRLQARRPIQAEPIRIESEPEAVDFDFETTGRSDSETDADSPTAAPGDVTVEVGTSGEQRLLGRQRQRTERTAETDPERTGTGRDALREESAVADLSEFTTDLRITEDVGAGGREDTLGGSGVDTLSEIGLGQERDALPDTVADTGAELDLRGEQERAGEFNAAEVVTEPVSEVGAVADVTPIRPDVFRDRVPGEDIGQGTGTSEIFDRAQTFELERLEQRRETGIETERETSTETPLEFEFDFAVSLDRAGSRRIGGAGEEQRFVFDVGTGAELLGLDPLDQEPGGDFEETAPGVFVGPTREFEFTEIEIGGGGTDQDLLTKGRNDETLGRVN